MTNRTMPPTYDRALLMIQDRIAGVYDAPDLVAWGPLRDCADDVREMVEAMTGRSRQTYEAPELRPIPPEEVPAEAHDAFERGRAAFEVRAANGASAAMRVEGGAVRTEGRFVVGEGDPVPDPVEALGLTDPGDVFERPGKALRRILSEFVPLHREQVEAGDWDSAALAFAEHLGHGARPQPTDLPMDGTQASYRQLLEQALRALSSASYFSLRPDWSPRDSAVAAGEALTRLRALVTEADKAAAIVPLKIGPVPIRMDRVPALERRVTDLEAQMGTKGRVSVRRRLRILEDRVALLVRAEARRLETIAPEDAS